MKKIYYRLKFVPRSPLRIGNGMHELSDSDLMLDGRGLPFIPGTSLAGIIRHRAGSICSDKETLKRLFGNIEDERKPILYTLNTLAMYLGFNSWEEYNSKHSFDSDYDYSDDTVYLSQLMPDTLIEVAYLNRVVTFRVILHDGIKALKVESSANSSLQVGDIVVLYSLKEGTCIEATQVIRGKSLGNYKTHGEITSIKIEEP